LRVTVVEGRYKSGGWQYLLPYGGEKWFIEVGTKCKLQGGQRQIQFNMTILRKLAASGQKTKRQGVRC